LHMAQLMPLPLTVSCFSKIQIGFTFLIPADLGSPGKGPLNGCVCKRVCVLAVECHGDAEVARCVGLMHLLSTVVGFEFRALLPRW